MIFKSAVQNKRVIYPKGSEVPADFDETVLESLIAQGIVGEPDAEVVAEVSETVEDDGAEKPSVRMKKEELITLAEAKGIQVDETMSKSDIVAALLEA